ncbi:nuclear transport factor 2 family protein [Pseudonocardia spinosispora]|uniref:nuclear transport factor 2 family protein n=1 Tax=Pseudonocardia spinosispora TaxID=103441 RepID=UPI00040F44C5|nr:nuclear transport factor 2 family protein [Pseudonocardia spinosispora]
MSLESDVRYLLDRIEIQDVIARYALGQDLHQPHSDNLNVLEHWSDVFSEDAVLDYSEAGMPAAMSRDDLADVMRGPNRDAGMAAIFTVWQHVEGHATVTIDGDKATALSPHLHSHETRTGQPANVMAAGMFHDDLERRPEGWRIVHRRLKNLYVHTVPRSTDAEDLRTSDRV